MPVSQLLALVGVASMSGPCTNMTMVDLRALEMEFGRYSRINKLFIATSGDFSPVCEEEQLNSLLYADSFSQLDIDEMRALPVRPFITR